MSSDSDIALAFKAQRERVKQRKARRLESASDEGWEKHTHYHWYRFVNGHKMDYWPSTGKVQYKGKMMAYGKNRYKKIMEASCK